MIIMFKFHFELLNSFFFVFHLELCVKNVPRNMKKFNKNISLPSKSLSAYTISLHLQRNAEPHEVSDKLLTDISMSVKNKL